MNLSTFNYLFLVSDHQNVNSAPLQVTVEWEPPQMDRGLELHGYEIYVDRKLLRRLLTKDTRQMIINDLEPWYMIYVNRL